MSTTAKTSALAALGLGMLSLPMWLLLGQPGPVASPEPIAAAPSTARVEAPRLAVPERGLEADGPRPPVQRKAQVP